MPKEGLTLPRKSEDYVSEELFPFFDGLIPEGWLLNLAQKNWKIPKNDRMTLLLTTCQDCIGAAHVLGTTSSKAPAPTVKNHLGPKIAFHSHLTSDRCLICLDGPLKDENLYHAKCAKDLFGFAYFKTFDPRISRNG